MSNEQQSSIWYLCYPFVGTVVPSWVAEIRPIINSLGGIWVDPGLRLSANAEQGDGMLLADGVLVTTDRVAARTANLRESDLLDHPVSEPVVARLLREADERPTAPLVRWRNLYLLARADFVLAEIGQPGLGGHGAEIATAFQWDCYIIGVSDSNCMDPQLVSMTQLIVRPHELSNVLEVLTHGHPRLQIR